MWAKSWADAMGFGDCVASDGLTAPQVAGPVIGAREGGVGGFFAGLGAGLATLAIAPVVGVGVGVRQALPIPSCA